MNHQCCFCRFWTADESAYQLHMLYHRLDPRPAKEDDNDEDLIEHCWAIVHAAEKLDYYEEDK